MSDALLVWCGSILVLDYAEEPEAKELSEPPRLLGAFTTFEVLTWTGFSHDTPAKV